MGLVVWVVCVVAVVGPLAHAMTPVGSTLQTTTTTTATVGFSSWQRIPEFYFFFSVFAFYFARYMDMVRRSMKRRKWLAVSRAFPTFEMYEGAHMADDSPGVEEVCHEWGQRGQSPRECYAAMLSEVGDQTWDNGEHFEMRWRNAFRDIATGFPFLFAMLVLLMSYMNMWSTAQSQPLATLGDDHATSATGSCGPLYVSDLGVDTAYQGIDGAFMNGDTLNEFGIRCETDGTLNSVCEVACRPGYTVGPHFGSVAVCGFSDGAVAWRPSGSAHQDMCSPDILMATPGLQFHLRSDVVAADSQSWRDVSGYSRHAVLDKDAMDDPADFTHNEGSHHLFSDDAHSVLLRVSGLPGEQVHLASGANVGHIDSPVTPHLNMLLLAVVSPSNANDYYAITDLVNVEPLWSTARDAVCRPVDNKFHVVSVVAWEVLSSTGVPTQRFAIRVDGHDCNGDTTTPNAQTIPQGMASTTWHNVRAFTDDTFAMIGCSFAEASRGTACAAANQFNGRMAEVMWFTNVRLDPSEACGTGAQGASVNSNTNCGRYRLEAMEFYLTSKYNAPALTCYTKNKNVFCSEGF